MDKTKLYIHIGTWKTGSSTIQYHLKHNIPKLKEEGIIYLASDQKIVEDYKVIREAQEVDQQFIQGSRAKLKYILETKQKTNEQHRILTSSESFSGNPFEGFKNVHIVAQTLKQITKDLNLDIYIIVYLRRQDDFIESMYTQSIHLGASHSFEEFLAHFDVTSFNWEYLLQSYADNFGKDKLIVRRYHKQFLPEENSLLQSFGKIIDSKFLENYTSTNSRNRGLSRDALEISRITNKYFDNDTQYQLRNIFQEVNSKEPFEKYAFFNGHERTKYLSRYSASNGNVEKEYFNETGGTLFPEPEAEEIESHYHGLSNEAIVVNLSKAVLAVNQRLGQKEKKMREEFQNMFIKRRIRNRIVLLLSRYPALNNRIRRLVKRT